MKKDKLYIFMTIFQWLFFVAFPLALTIMQFTTVSKTDGGTGFIINASIYVFILIIYAVMKKVFLKNYFNDLGGKIINYTTQLETETDQTKIPLIEKALSKNILIRHAVNVIPILAVSMLTMVVVKAIEQSLVKMYSVLGLILVSFVLGFICMIIQSTNIKSKNRRVE